jgi:adenylosuccinate synthase
MSVRVVIGAQWGDEGKGKVIDLLSPKAKYVVRYQGGANAGHTLKFDDTTIVLHLVPSGIFHNDTKCIIGNGVVIDPVSLLEELEEVKSHGIDPKNRLFISEGAHVILPYHKLIDKSKEAHKGDKAIGTTGRGIGPAYMSKVTRSGIRMLDLLDPKSLEAKLKDNVIEANALLSNYNADPVDFDEIWKELTEAGKKLESYIANTSAMLHDALDNNENILLEGAQGALLDIDHGTYPFVTSSSPTAGGACTGSGIPPMAITNVMGITKAYCTRVGNGPFPTELKDEAGEKLREIGHEFGATTGRPRRCGWIDLVALKYAVRINGINELALTKVDVLDHFKELQACTHYEIDGKKTDIFPLSATKLEKAKPVFKKFNGWNTETRGLEKGELPLELINYIAYLEDYLGAKVVILSSGPKRSETLMLSEVN